MHSRDLHLTVEPRTSRHFRAVAALLPPLVALGLQWVLWPVIHPYSWFLFYPAVFISSWIGGYRGGLLATALSTGLVWWFFVSPEQTLLKTEIKHFFCGGRVFQYGHPVYGVQRLAAEGASSNCRSIAGGEHRQCGVATRQPEGPAAV